MMLPKYEEIRFPNEYLWQYHDMVDITFKTMNKKMSIHYFNSNNIQVFSNSRDDQTWSSYTAKAQCYL